MSGAPSKTTATIYSPATPLNEDLSSPQSLQSILPGAVIINHINLKPRTRGRPRMFSSYGGETCAHSFSEMDGQAQDVGESASPTVIRAYRGKNQKEEGLGAGSIATGFTPHIININAGEEISSKILAITQNAPMAVCVLSATGAISSVTLHWSGGTTTYEGRFDVLSLSGLVVQIEIAGHKTRTGGLNIALSGSDGRVIGGCVADFLVAASPVQNAPMAVCILSATGAISSVTLHQSGGTTTYEGRFDVLSLFGSIVQMEIAGHKTRTCSLNIVLSGSYGRVIGGCVADFLVATSPDR